MARALANIYLVGLPGSGKTTIGRALARLTARDFYDSDQILIEKTGVTVKTIFDLEGETGFRAREKKAIFELTQKRNIILATGGGAILDAANRQALAATGIVVYLAAEPDFIARRMVRDTVRPLFQDASPEAKLKELYQTRKPLYEEIADIIFPVNEHAGSVYRSAKKIQLFLKNDRKFPR